MEERLGHSGFISTFNPTIETIISRLERHLYKGIRTKAMASDESLAVALEFKHLGIILTDEI
jgi:hypothetical protein